MKLRHVLLCSLFLFCEQQRDIDENTFLQRVELEPLTHVNWELERIAAQTAVISPPTFSPRRLVRRVCVQYSDAVPGAIRGAVGMLLSHVPGTIESTTCDQSDHLLMNIDVDSLLAPEEIVITSDETAGVRVMTVRSGVGKGHRTAIGFALFRALEEMGFSFLHPLQPQIPGGLSLPMENLSIRETPVLRIRGIHLHTMHPIELADLLNGWGPGGPDDEAGYTAQIPLWHTFLQWMLANGLNRVQWALLWNQRWKSFADSAVRQQRLAELVQIAHEYGVDVGIDAPMSLTQQNAFRLIRRTGDLSDELRQIQTQVDYLMRTGIDFLALESGTSEFTHSNPTRMLAWMNFITHYADSMYHKPVSMKVHVSSGQTVDELRDPVSGGKLNVNFLPYYADSRLGVMAHTVEYYGLTDPAPVYGNDTFAAMEQYMQIESGHREVLWYPESAYWCSFDIDVPLFLPLYAERRFNDLRRILQDSQRGKYGDGIDGQVVFSSGWEWGYWLGDVAAARAAWNPMQHISDDDTAYVYLLTQIFSGFEETAFPLAQLIAEVAFSQRQLLIWGDDAPGSLHSMNPTVTGQAYLQGIDTLDEMAELFEQLPGAALTPTQPGRISLLIGSDDNRLTHQTAKQLSDVLERMTVTFTQMHHRLSALAPVVEKKMLSIYEEFNDGLQITALRAAQMRALYFYQFARAQNHTQTAEAFLADSQSLMQEAETVVHRRELSYRVDSTYLARWRDNPTAYHFGYLWTVHSLYYWKRDHLKLSRARVHPCDANIFDPFELAYGQVPDSPGFRLLRLLINTIPGLEQWKECLTVSGVPKW
ncbi:MAG: hypothetical protein JXX29_12575 [Deltaproteobacteria bacterium]|nr:hypothetical protein [Deltaproteobacteria bacterium]MBN2672510.1 hypothetical protein [Deltaproteobacteria bacterium]